MSEGLFSISIMSFVSGSLLYASFHVACWGSLSMVAPDKNARAVAAGAAALDESTNSDCPSRILVSVDSIASIAARDVLAGRAVSSRSMCLMSCAN
jgi:hypothetical protein